MKYKKATVEVVMFDNSDVITTSGCDSFQNRAGDWWNDHCSGNVGSQTCTNFNGN